MKNNLLILIIASMLLGCGNQPDESNGNSSAIDLSELKHQQGDCVSFKIDSNLFAAGIVIDISKEEDGIWYGLCFTDYIDTIKPNLSILKKQQIAGRKIASSLNSDGFVIGFDTEYVQDSCFVKNLDRFVPIGKLQLKPDKFIIGSRAAIKKYDELITLFQRSRERRLTPPDHYNDHIQKLEKFRPDEYFKLIEYIEE